MSVGGGNEKPEQGREHQVIEHDVWLSSCITI